MSPHGLDFHALAALAPGIVRTRAILAVLIAANLIGLIAIVALTTR